MTGRLSLIKRGNLDTETDMHTGRTCTHVMSRLELCCHKLKSYQKPGERPRADPSQVPSEGA